MFTSLTDPSALQFAKGTKQHSAAADVTAHAAVSIPFHPDRNTVRGSMGSGLSPPNMRGAPDGIHRLPLPWPLLLPAPALPALEKGAYSAAAAELAMLLEPCLIESAPRCTQATTSAAVTCTQWNVDAPTQALIKISVIAFTPCLKSTGKK